MLQNHIPPRNGLRGVNRAKRNSPNSKSPKTYITKEPRWFFPYNPETNNEGVVVNCPHLVLRDEKGEARVVLGYSVTMAGKAVMVKISHIQRIMGYKNFNDVKYAVGMDPFEYLTAEFLRRLSNDIPELASYEKTKAGISDIISLLLSDPRTKSFYERRVSFCDARLDARSIFDALNKHPKWENRGYEGQELSPSDLSYQLQFLEKSIGNTVSFPCRSLPHFYAKRISDDRVRLYFYPGRHTLHELLVGKRKEITVSMGGETYILYEDDNKIFLKAKSDQLAVILEVRTIDYEQEGTPYPKIKDRFFTNKPVFVSPDLFGKRRTLTHFLKYALNPNRKRVREIFDDSQINLVPPEEVKRMLVSEFVDCSLLVDGPIKKPVRVVGGSAEDIRQELMRRGIKAE
ncbi:MAG: hypothetical protein QXP42_05130 [Candidatus Micrarchaeia archaeon]